jgi:phage gpG-like protein
MDISFEDHSDEILQLFAQAKERALEAVGLQAEGYAKKLCPVDTGVLRNTITHAVDDDNAYIGTNNEYAPYVELGTGKYYPGGRQTPWVYQDSKGNWHITSGQRAQPYLKPAVADHGATYRSIIEQYMKND